MNISKKIIIENEKNNSFFFFLCEFPMVVVLSDHLICLTLYTQKSCLPCWLLRSFLHFCAFNISVAFLRYGILKCYALFYSFLEVSFLFIPVDEIRKTCISFHLPVYQSDISLFHGLNNIHCSFSSFSNVKATRVARRCQPRISPKR